MGFKALAEGLGLLTGLTDSDSPSAIESALGVVVTHSDGGNGDPGRGHLGILVGVVTRVYDYKVQAGLAWPSAVACRVCVTV